MRIYVELKLIVLCNADTSLEELSDIASENEQEEVAVYKEPSMYDNLLKTLGSASESTADAYKRR